MSDQELLDAYQRAYSRPEIQGIKGNVRAPAGSPIPGGADVPPAQAIRALFDFMGYK
jgi:hypothetical protein